MSKNFNYYSNDSQGTLVKKVKCTHFDYDQYLAYEEELLERCNNFWNTNSGILVYRRFRVPEVYSYGCRDMKKSLELQLGALKRSMNFKADIPNFLEPWYGIGTIASAFGAEYSWLDNQAPAIEAIFSSVQQALDYPCRTIENTIIGSHTLQMIEYFLDATKGKLPISYSDIQSPLNITSSIVDINSFFMELFDRPEKVKQLFAKIVNIFIPYMKKQRSLIGANLASPGHGFASCRAFKGIGLSDDNMLMISNEQYEEFETPIIETIGEAFGGIAFHSCGDWSRKIDSIKKIKNLLYADGAFSEETDPSPNDINNFEDKFVDSGVILHARIVGDAKTVINQVKKIWKPGLRLIVTTYCKDPHEQAKVYDEIHKFCS